MFNFISMRQVSKALRFTGISVITPFLLIGALGMGNIASASGDPGLAPGKLSVAAIDSASGKAVANATVLVVNAQSERVAKGLTNSNGVFETKLPAGTYKVTIFANNFKEFGQVITLSAGQVTTLKAGLQTTIQLTAAQP